MTKGTRRGLDACGELVAAASSGQLTAILDLDLWRSSRPGGGVGFDAQRFGEWLEMLVEIGEVTAARTLAALDTNLVVAGLSRYIRVFDLAAVTVMPSDEDEHSDPLNQIVDSSLRCEIGGYVVCARRSDAWDAIVTLLLELHAEHPAHFDAVLIGCRRMSNSAPEIDGLDDLLAAPEQLLHDVTLDRERRQSHQGYVTPGDAHAFLQLSRQRTGDPSRPVGAARAIASAYFRTYKEFSDADRARAPQSTDVPEAGVDDEPSSEGVFELLTEVLGANRPLLLTRTATEPSSLTIVRPLLAHIRDTDEGAFVARNRELAFLANALSSGSSVQSRSFTPEEASDASLRVCNLGLERWAERGALPLAFLRDHDLLSAFGEGWAILHEEVALFVADRLIAITGAITCSDVDIQRGLYVLGRELTRQRAAGTPWRAVGRLEVIAMLDPVSWAALRGVLGECPVLPDALRASLHHQTRAVSATAFTFIETRSQIDEVRTFMDRLLDILTG